MWKIKNELNIFLDSSLDFNIESKNFRKIITRLEFNILSEVFFEKYVELIDNTLEYANLNKNICTIILKGEWDISHMSKLQ